MASIKDTQSKETKGENRESVDANLAKTALQSGQVIIIKISSTFLGFGFNYFLAHYFGAHIVGQFSLVQAIVNICAVFTVFGLNAGLIKYIPQFKNQSDYGKLRAIVSDAFKFGFLFSCIATVGLILSRGIIAREIFKNEQLVDLLLWGGFALVPVTLTRVADGWYRGFKKASRFNFYNLVIYKFILFASVGVLPVIGLVHARWVVVVYVGAFTVLACLLVVKARDFDVGGSDVLHHIFFSTEKAGQYSEIRQKLLRYSSTMLLVTFMAFLLGKTDILMIGYFMEPEAVGIYRIALLISNTVLITLTSVNSIFPAFISELYASQRIRELDDMYGATTKWILVISMPLAITLGVFADVILAFFGEAFVSAVTALLILVIGFLVSAGVGANGHILRIVGFEKIELYNTVAIVVMNIAINLLIIPRYGIEGAAIATALSVGLVSIIKIFEVQYLVGVFPYNWHFWHLIPSALICGGLALLARGVVDDLVSVGIAFAVNLFIFGGMAYWFRDETDAGLLKHALAWKKRKLG